MLSKDDIETIQLTEHLRYRIRADFERLASPPVRRQLTTFINSPLGILLISSVLIAGMGRLYANYVSHSQKLLHRRTELTKILTEIDYRIAQIEFWQRQLSIENTNGPEIQIWRIVRGDREFSASQRDFQGLSFYGVFLRTRLYDYNVASPDTMRSMFALERLGYQMKWTYDAKTIEPELIPLRAARDSLKSYVQHGVDLQTSAWWLTGE
jgi:hypothetical protein